MQKTSPMACHGHSHSKPTLEGIVAAIRAGGLKITNPRQTLVQSMLKFHQPFSAEDLFQQTSGKAKPGCDLVTIYRTLAKFEELKLVSRVDLGDGTVRYEVLERDGSHHHHVVCVHCRRIEPITDCMIQGQEKMLAKLGYTQVSHRLEFFGVCSKCSS